MTVKKILWISDFTDTGYTNASICLLKYLIKKPEKYEIRIFGINHYMIDTEFRENCEKIFPEFPSDKIYTINNKGFFLNYKDPKIWMSEPYAKEMIMHQRFGAFDLKRVLYDYNPDMVISINDNGALEIHKKIINRYEKEINKKIIKIFYIPIDCYNLPKEFFKELEGIEHLITMTETGCSEIMKTGYRGKIDVLPHSINTEKFYKLTNKKELRDKWLPEKIREKFIILNSNKNQDRKRLDISIIGFQKLLEKAGNKNKYALVLKTGKGPSFNNGGLKLDEFISKLPGFVSENIFIIDKRMTLEELNELYNVCDVNINTSIGEGWGIIPCEVSLCGIPQLVPDSTSYPEIFFKECLIRTVEMPRLLCMTGSGDIPPEGIQVIARGYKQYLEDDYKINKLPTIKPLDMESILISEMGNDEMPRCMASVRDGLKIVFCFKSVKKCFEFLETHCPDVFQVFVHNGVGFSYVREKLEEVEKDKLDKKLSKLYKLETLDIQSIYAGQVMVKVPLIESLIENIEKLYSDKRRREIIGEMCERTIRSRYDIDTVGEQLEYLLDKYILEGVEK